MSPAATLAPSGPPVNSNNPVSVPAGGAGQNNAPAALVPFVQAAREQLQPGPNVQPQAVSAANPIQLGLLELPPMGYAKGFWIELTVTGGTSTGATVAAGDAPWTAIQTLVVLDTNGAEVVGPISGYDLYLINKYGGYRFLGDPASDPFFSAVATASGAGSGNFSFRLWVPFEVSERDALSALPNMDASAPLKARLTLSTSGSIYTTAPTTLGTYNCTIWYSNWTQPNAQDMFGHPQQQVPDDVGTTQFWTTQTYNIPAGNFPVKLLRIGNLIRLLINVFRNNAGARDDTDFPNPFQFVWDGRQLYNVSPTLLKTNMSRRYGYTAAQMDVGVWSIDFCHDLDGQVGHELRTQWLPTTDATLLQYLGSYGVAGTLEVLTNDIAPVGDIYLPGLVYRS